MLTRRQKIAKLSRRFALQFRSFEGPAHPLFIFGCQRSGTNMTMQVLGNCPETECFWENDDEAFDNFRLRDRKTIAALIASSRAKAVVFKPITESQHAATLLDDHDGARGLWVYRHYNDVVNSALRNFREHRKYLYYMLYEPEIANWRIENVPASALSLIRNFYGSGISDASAQALIWWLRNQHFRLQKLQSRNDVLLVKYEDAVRNPVPAFETVFRFAKLDFAPALAKPIFGTSVARRDPPKIDDAVRALCEETLLDLDRILRGQLSDMNAAVELTEKTIR